jgi:hypothetical protein
MLRHGGRLAFSEPYCATEEAKAAFGRAQIEAGISEQTYLLHEWHQAMVDAGLRLRVSRVSDSFGAVYEKADGGDRDLFARFYDGRLTVLDTPSVVQPGSVLLAPILLENRGNGVWTSVSQFPVYASYHVRRAAPEGDVLLSFDNPRTRLPFEIGPGHRATMAVEVTVPVEPGDYAVEIDLVHEYVAWFAPKGLGRHVVRFRAAT